MNVVHPITGYPPYGDSNQIAQGQYPPQYGSAPPAGGGYPPQTSSTGPGTGLTPVYTYQGPPPTYYAPPGATYPAPSYSNGAPSSSLHTYPPYNTIPGQGGAYPTQQAFPMQQGDYPVQQGAYPVQQSAYPVQQGTHPAYPPYSIGQQAPQGMMAAGVPYQPYSTTPSSPPYGMQPPPGYPPPYGVPPMDVAGAHTNPLPGLQPLVQYPPINNQSAIPKPGSEHSTHATSQFTMREWSVGVCGCSTHCIPNCFMPWCCPCVSLAQIYARIGLASYRVALIRFCLLIGSGVLVRFVPMNDSERRSNTGISSSSDTATMLTGTTWYVFLVGQQIVLLAAIAFTRRRVRQRFKIPGNQCSDVLISCLCPCCTIAQMATQSRSYTPGTCDFSGPDVLPAFL